MSDQSNQPPRVLTDAQTMHDVAFGLERNPRFQVRMIEREYSKRDGTLVYQHKLGMHVTCKNGNVVSVQWGPGSYCEKYDQSLSSPNVTPDSVDAEIAIWDKDGNWHGFEGDDVLGWQTPEQVMSWILWASRSEVVPRSRAQVLGLEEE
tara:strand:- start:370 stop:816 length:447 start_codon:yes stop_codon:yes gene_type:complete